MKIFGLTDVGKMRSVNQDTFSIDNISECAALFTVCDGMGGANGGQEASSLAINIFNTAVAETLRKRCGGDGIPDATPQQIRRLFNAGLSRANEALIKKSKEDSSLSGMGTTLVSVLITPSKVYVLNIGDSRMYGDDGKEFTQITKDHSYVQYLVDEGMIKPEEAANHPNKNVITRAIGISDNVEADFYEFSYKTFRRILLCSDGLTNYVSDEIISQIISDKEKKPDERVRALVDIANENGGGDNITVVLAQLSEK